MMPTMDGRPNDEVIEPAGRIRVLARSSLTTVMAFRHHPDASHHDPAEECFERPTAIFTSSGAWGLWCGAGAVEGTPETVVIGAPGRTFRASHPGRRALDTAVCVEFHDVGDASGRDDPAWDRAFSRPGAPRTATIGRVHLALVREATERSTGFALTVDGLSMQLVAELARAHEGSWPDAGRRRLRSDLRDRVHQARGYLDEHLAEDVGLDELARSVALSPFYLSRLFRREFGIPPTRTSRAAGSSGAPTCWPRRR